MWQLLLLMLCYIKHLKGKNMEELQKIIENIKGADEEALQKAIERQHNLLKPKGSLGALEDISIKMAGITGKINNEADKRILFLFGADNGVYDEGVAATPQYFTKILINSYADNVGTGINVITKSCNTDLKLIDMGIKGGINHKNIDNRNLMINGTNNFAVDKAIPYDIVIKAVKIGIEYAKYAKDKGYNVIGNGEIGMANTTTAAACIMALVKSSNKKLVGRGAGLNDDQLEKKREVIRKAITKYNLFHAEPFEILSCVGGLDIAAMTGLYLGAAYYRLPIVIDGLISISAALMAYNIKSEVKDFMFTSHHSEEPAYLRAVNALGLEPMLNLHMRLGEGSGCPIAMQIIENACHVMNNMQTFQEINLEDEYRKDIIMK